MTETERVQLRRRRTAKLRERATKTILMKSPNVQTSQELADDGTLLTINLKAACFAKRMEQVDDMIAHILTSEEEGYCLVS